MAVAMGGCTGVHREAPQKKAEHEGVEEPATAAEQESKPRSNALRIGLLDVRAQRTPAGGLRWEGRGRISGTKATEHSVLMKTTCRDGDLALTQVEYPSIDGGTASLGVPDDGRSFEFSGLGWRRGLAPGAPCELHFLLVDHADGRTAPTRSARACLRDDMVAIGPCEAGLLEVQRRPNFRLLRVELDGDLLRFAARVQEQPKGSSSFYVRASCLSGSGDDVRVGTARTFRSWGVISPGEAAEDEVVLPTPVVRDASACRLEFWLGPTRPLGELPEGVAGAQMCWSRAGDRASCKMLEERHPVVSP